MLQTENFSFGSNLIILRRSSLPPSRSSLLKLYLQRACESSFFSSQVVIYNTIKRLKGLDTE